MDKKNQHFVPQALLRNFTIEGERSLIWELSKVKAEYSKLAVSVREICAKDFYYYQRDENDAIDHRAVEDSFGEVETIGANILRAVIEQMNKPMIDLAQKEQGEFAFYLALLFTRGPAFRDAVHQFRAEQVQAVHLQLQAEGSLPKLPPELQEVVNAKEFMAALRIDIFPHVSLRPMVEFATRIAESMLEKSWTFCRCSSLIPITDRPFVSFTPEGPGIDPTHPEAQIMFPLHRHLFLYVGPGDPQRDAFECRRAVDGHVKLVRWALVAAADEYVYSSEKNDELVDLCKQLRLEGPKTTPDAPEGKMWRVLDVPPKGATFRRPNA